MGSYGVGGKVNNGKKQTIAGGRVTVLAPIWKVLLMLPEGNDDWTHSKSSTRVIAVDTPNRQMVRVDWGSYRTSIAAIKKASGYNW